MLRSNERPKGSFLKDKSGTSLVEFAFTVPFLVLLVLGLIEVGRYMAYSVIVGNAVRAGAQVGAMGSTEAQATPDPTQSPGANLDYMASQAACIDVTQSLSVANSGFSCTSSGSANPSNALKITTTISCVPSPCSNQQPAPSNQTMYITVSASGKYTSLLRLPFVPNNVPMTAQSTLRVTE